MDVTYAWATGARFVEICTFSIAQYCVVLRIFRKQTFFHFIICVYHVHGSYHTFFKPSFDQPHHLIHIYLYTKLKSEISSAHSKLSELRSAIEERGQYSHASSGEVNLRIFDEDPHQVSQFQRPRAPASTSNTDSVEESVSLREVLEAEQTTQGPGGEGSGSGTGLEEGGAVSEVKDPERKRKAAVGAGGGGGGKLVLLQQVTQ